MMNYIFDSIDSEDRCLRELDNTIIVLWANVLFSKKQRGSTRRRYKGIIGMKSWDKTKYDEILKIQAEIRERLSVNEEADIWRLGCNADKIYNEMNSTISYFWEIDGNGTSTDKLEDLYPYEGYYVAEKGDEINKQCGHAWVATPIRKLAKTRFYNKMLDEMVLAKLSADFI